MKTKSDRKKRKLIIAGGLLVATMVLASAFLVGSGAVFTATSANPTNVFTAGTLTMSNDHAGALLTASLMKPGDTVSGDVTIKNTGTLSGKFELDMAKVTSSAPNGSDIYDALTVVITEGVSTVYTGPLAAIASTPVTLGTWAPNASHTYHIVATFPNASGNGYQGSSATVDFTWIANQ